MDGYHICGGHAIEGEYTVHGAKNAALPILAATILIEDDVELLECPGIADVENMLEILKTLGCKVERSGRTVYINASEMCRHAIPLEFMGGMRSSVFLMGPLLARCEKAVLGTPGGCEIGRRPIDIHVAALAKLGVCVKMEDGLLVCRAGQLTGADITLEFPSVGATENVMMAALAAEGETIIRNSAREPEIVDLQKFLVRCGAKIKGAGSGTITVSGRKNPSKFLGGTTHKIMPDRIETGTLLAAAAGTGGQIFACGAQAAHMEAVLEKFQEAGCQVRKDQTGIFLKATERLSAIDLTTMPYPGFPTDMQSQFLALMTTARGTSHIRETIFENRYKQTEELSRMGASICIHGQEAEIRGVQQLKGKTVSAADLRGGASLVLAGLMAEGETIIESIGHIERGYDKLEELLRELGAKIQKIVQ